MEIELLFEIQEAEFFAKKYAADTDYERYQLVCNTKGEMATRDKSGMPDAR